MSAGNDEPPAFYIQHAAGQIFQKEKMMSKRTMGIGLIVVGVIVLIVSLAADSLGIGGAPGIGFKQIGGAVVGVIVAIVGGWLSMGEKNQKK
jgi:hypothetical protein